MASKHNISLAAYHLPGSGQIQLDLQTEGRPQSDLTLSEALQEGGFILAPFSKREEQSLYLIQADQQLYGQEAIAFLNQLEQVPERTTDSAHFSSSSEYLDQFDRMHRYFTSGQVRKAILSRIQQADKPEDFHPGKTFLELVQAYPRAFTYLVSIPGVGTWIGATPETLVSSHQGSGRTMALAGTLPQEGNREKAPWSAKEREEQGMVATYIREVLERHEAAPIDEDGPHTAGTGKVWHLRTNFDFHWPETPDTAAQLIEDLHPTPAVSGLPVEQSLDLIYEIEAHQRSYYAGFIGPVQAFNNLDLFVNLRCMEVFTDRLGLYVGGGLTASSIAAHEWRETVLKADTLLAVMQNLQNFDAPSERDEDE